MKKKYAFLGPRGTYTEEALLNFLGKEKHDQIPINGIEEVMMAVSEGKVDYGMVPVENSIEGTVNQTLDGLMKLPKLFIVGEHYVPISHSLMARKNTAKEKIQKIASHPQALAQCRNYIKINFPNAEIVELSSTTKAMEFAVMSNDNVAVIGNSKAAHIYDLTILDEGIQDYEENITRFLLIGKDLKKVSGQTKTTLMVSITDRPGGLYEILKEFALANLTLTRIESRPAKKSFGDYIFFIDFVGNLYDPKVSECLSTVQRNTVSFRILGSYQMHSSTICDLPNAPRFKLEELRQHINIIDYQIVELLAKRMRLVTQIGELKTCAESVRDLDRENEIIQNLLTIAKTKNVNPGLIERIYKNIFDYSVSIQEKQFQR